MVKPNIIDKMDCWNGPGRIAAAIRGTMIEYFIRRDVEKVESELQWKRNRRKREIEMSILKRVDGFKSQNPRYNLLFTCAHYKITWWL